MNILIPLMVMLPLLGAAIALVLGRNNRAQVIVNFVTLSTTLVIAAIILYTVTVDGSYSVHIGGWLPPWGIVLVVDQLSALMIVISAVMLLGVLLFSIGQGLADGNRETPVTIFHPTYMILSAGVFDAFLAGDLFNMYVGFEILLAASFVLMTLGGTGPRIRAGVTYIVVSLVSSLFFLISIALIYGATGTVNIAQLSVRLGELPVDVQLLLHIMLLIAFGIKAAIFPLSFWLPDSYPNAPAPVTAVFAGLLTKVGVYAIIRTQTVLFPAGQLSDLLMIVGALTMVIGILGAIAQADLKRMLSFTLVSHIGYMVFGVAVGSVQGLTATIYYVMHHIAVQTTLFLAAGLIERVGGSTSISRLSGLLKASPIVAILFFIPALNLGGIPPFSGFLGKVGLFQAATEQGSVLSWVVIAAGAVTSLLTLYALMRFWNMAFWRTEEELDGYTSLLLESLRESPEDDGQTSTRLRTPRLMTMATGGMVGFTVLLTVFAGPVFAMSEKAALQLETPDIYVQTVYPSGIPDGVPDEFYEQEGGEH